MATRCRFFHHTAVFGCCKGNQICLPGTLSLSPALGSVHLSTLTACGIQGLMKLETPPPPIYILLSQEIYTISLLLSMNWDWHTVIKSVYSYNVILWHYFKGTLQIQTWNWWILLIQAAATTQCIFLLNEWTIQHFMRPLSGMPLCVSNLTLLLYPSFRTPCLLIFWLTLMMFRPLFKASLNSTHSPVLQEFPRL